MLKRWYIDDTVYNTSRFNINVVVLNTQMEERVQVAISFTVYCPFPPCFIIKIFYPGNFIQIKICHNVRTQQREGQILGVISIYRCNVTDVFQSVYIFSPQFRKRRRDQSFHNFQEGFALVQGWDSTYPTREEKKNTLTFPPNKNDFFLVRINF